VSGEGMDETILSFAGQTSGAEGFLVQADDFLIHDLALEDSPGDLLKILGGNGVTIRRVRAEWTRGADPRNGSYGLYPVQCENVLIEDSIVRGASDAGLYVGQSKNIIMRRNLVEQNVAGIEVENSQDADVYDNIAQNNTGGILVFNLPGLPVKDGRRTRVFRNQVLENNTPNFAPGGIVQSVPDGTGILILANDEVEVFENTFRDNGTSQVSFISFNTAELLGGASSNDPEFDPYCESLFIHDNVYMGGGDNPDPDLGPILVQITGGLPLPQILTDGDEDPDKQVDGQTPAALRNCIQESDATFVDLDVPGGFANPSFDLAAYDCTHEPLPPVVIPGVE
jgi:parallel beta-helix repeat protein